MFTSPSGSRCTSSDDGLTLAATDLELGIRTQCPPCVRKNGAGTILAHKLLDERDCVFVLRERRCRQHSYRPQSLILARKMVSPGASKPARRESAQGGTFIILPVSD